MRTAAVRHDLIAFRIVIHNWFQFLPVSLPRRKLNGLKPCGINNQKKWYVAGIGVAFPQGLTLFSGRQWTEYHLPPNSPSQCPRKEVRVCTLYVYLINCFLSQIVGVSLASLEQHGELVKRHIELTVLQCFVNTSRLQQLTALFNQSVILVSGSGNSHINTGLSFPRSPLASRLLLMKPLSTICAQASQETA